MTLVAHSLIAVAIASKYSNPVIGLPLVLLSHFVVDKIPHWDVMTNKQKTHRQIATGTFVDIFAGFVLAGIFNALFLKSGVNPTYFFLAVFVSQMPDLLEAPYIISQLKNPISTRVYQFQHYIHDIWFDSRLEAPWGVITQIITIGVFLFWSLT